MSRQERIFRLVPAVAEGRVGDMPTSPPPANPPRPPQRPHTHRHHGDERVDEYAWLRERDHPAKLRGELFDEYRSRIKETDEDVPARDGAWEYYTRTIEGGQYPIYARHPLRSGPPGGEHEQVLLDCNEAAEGTEYFALGALSVSPGSSSSFWSPVACS